MNSETSATSLSMLLASVTAGIAGTLVYHYLRKGTIYDAKRTCSSTQIVWHVEIPDESLAYVMGKDGSNIGTIEAQTGVTISFVDSGGPSCRLCVLRGSSEAAVQQAKELLLKTVEEYSQLETFEMCVPQKTLDYLTANESQKLREITAASKARVHIYRVQDKPNSLLIRGLHHQIETVRNIVKTIVVEDEKAEQMLGSLSNTLAVTREGRPVFERLEPTSSDGFCEVYISAVTNPWKFFVQKTGPVSKQLDRLVADMTDFYAEENNRQNLTISNVEVGQIVAAFTTDDSCWYRAKIISILPEDSSVAALILDFGDVTTIDVSNIATLRPEYLAIRFQAIECRLSHIEPIKDCEWSDTAVEKFEQLTYCQQWKVIMARVESYAQQEEGKLVPYVKLIDTNTETDINIATELVQLGLGVPI